MPAPPKRPRHTPTSCWPRRRSIRKTGTKATPSNGHTTLGLLAIRQGEVDKASEHLLESVQMEGSPQLNSFGPSMTLAKELLDKGEIGAVLQYFSLCRTFWKMGAQSLDAWSEAVRNGKTPNFGVSMR